jgi:hypothetical protein
MGAPSTEVTSLLNAWSNGDEAALAQLVERVYPELRRMAVSVVGENLIVRVVERYIAEQRSLLQQDVECRTALRDTLDAFVQAGWPSAQRLAYRLDGIFR